MEDNPLNKHWESIKAENYSGSFKEVENWIKAESYGGTNRPVKNRSYIVKTFSENKIKYAIIF